MQIVALVLQGKLQGIEISGGLCYNGLDFRRLFPGKFIGNTAKPSGGLCAVLPIAKVCIYG